MTHDDDNEPDRADVRLILEAMVDRYGVPRETVDRLVAYDAVLLDWSLRMNLVAKSTLRQRWIRHYEDSLQLAPLIPQTARDLIDLGSGAGFPGLVLAAAGAEAGLAATLIESTQKKAAFLRAAATAMSLRHVNVIADRIEGTSGLSADVVTARALAQLEKLFAYAEPLLRPDTVLLLPKGQHVDDELTSATTCWRFELDEQPSATDAGGRILIVRDLRRKSA